MREWKKAWKKVRPRRQLKFVQKLLAKNMSVKAIAELLDIPMREVRRLAKEASK